MDKDLHSLADTLLTFYRIFIHLRNAVFRITKPNQLFALKNYT